MNIAFLVMPRTLVRAGLRSLLESTGYVVTGETSDPTDALGPDARRAGLIILDPTACAGTPDLIGRIREGSDATIAIVGDSIEFRNLSRSQITAVDGIIPNDISPSAILRLLRLVEAGERVIPNDLLRSLTPESDVAGPKGPRLSPRAEDILRRLALGASSKAIARELGITEATVKVHLKALFQKLRVANRTQAALWATENGYAAANPLFNSN